jgi:DegV family protein with EDD domain
MDIKIISDGGADFQKGYLEKEDISIVPLSVHFEEETYASNTLSGHEFFDKMKTHKELPKTSSPSPYDFYQLYIEAYEQKHPILVISLSSGLSSTHQHAEMAKQMLLEEHSDALIEVIDSRTASVGLALLTQYAVELVKEGMELKAAANKIRELVPVTRTTFCLETLENVIKGGRLDRFRGAIASVMNIKLVMIANEEGKVEVVEKVRGTNSAMRRIKEMIGELSSDFEHKLVAVAHGNCEEKAKKVAEDIMKLYPFRGYFLANMGPVIGTYGGEGAIVVAY